MIVYGTFHCKAVHH